jgi:hypothetical protein
MSVELVLALIILDEFRCVSALERQKTTSVSFWMLFARGKRFLYNRSTSKKHSATAESAYFLRIAKTKQAILFLVTWSYCHSAGVGPSDRHVLSYDAEHSVFRPIFAIFH